MPQVSLYAKPSGEIVGRGVRDDAGHVSFDSADMGSVDGVFDTATHYVTGGAATPRPAFTPSVSATSIPANGTASVIIGNLPAGAQLVVDGAAPQAVTGATLELRFDVAATYAVVLQCWPYVPVSLTITATAP
jgi:hypothetical protein